MSEPRERVPTACPACSPEGPTAHEVLATGGQATVRCTECGHVHKSRIADESTVERRVIVSQEGDSFEAWADLPLGRRITVGDEFLLNAPEGVFSVRVTGVEDADDRRTDASPVEEVRTVWTRAIGNVAVDLTLHPKEGAGGQTETRSLKIHVPGDDEFVVGETHEYGGEEFTVEGLMVRDEASGYPTNGLDRRGDAAAAKDLKRVYARDESTVAWSAW